MGTPRATVHCGQDPLGSAVWAGDTTAVDPTLSEPLHVAREESRYACYAATLLEGIWHSEIPADLSGEEVGNLGVTRYRFHGPVLGITPERVRTTFALEVAPVPPEVPEQAGALHLIETVVRSAS
jgi:hypothetical protein